VTSKGLQIVYAPRADATPESEVATLASVYRFIFDSTKKETARLGGHDDEEESKNARTATAIIQED
jgi:hypothetical protein